MRESRKRKKASVDATNCCPTWMVTLGDAMSLMLCFFVLLLTFSDLDSDQLTNVLGVLSGSLGAVQAGVSSYPDLQEETVSENEELSPIVLRFRALKTPKRILAVERRLATQGFSNRVTIEELMRGIRITVSESALFTADGTLSAGGRNVLKEVGNLLNGVDNEVRLIASDSSESLPGISSYEKGREVADFLETCGVVRPRRFSFACRAGAHGESGAALEILLVEKSGLQRLRFADLWSGGEGRP